MKTSELIAGIVAGHPAARELLVKRYQDDVYTWFFLDDPESAELQAGRFFKNLLATRPTHASLAVWLFRQLLKETSHGGPLQLLSPEQRAALFLRDIAGLPEEEVQEILQIPASSFRARLHAARSEWARLEASRNF
jgi:hypothetical protein